MDGNIRAELICATMEKLMKFSVQAKEKDGTDIFVSWSSHVMGIEVRIHLGGWKRGEYGKGFEIYFRRATDENLEKEIDYFFSKIEAYLQSTNEKRRCLRVLEEELESHKAAIEEINRRIENLKKKEEES